MDEALLTSLLDSLSKGLRAGGSFKPEAWTLASSAVKDVAHGYEVELVTKERVQQRIQALKVLYRHWKEMMDQSGWGLDDYGCPQAPEDVMEEYFEAHSEARRFRTAPLFMASELAQLFDDVMAFGAHVKTASQLHLAARKASTAPLDDASSPGPLPLNKKRPITTERDDTPSKKRALAVDDIAQSLSRSVELMAQRHDLLAQPAAARAAALLFNDFRHLSEEALVVAAEALESENTASVFLKAPPHLQKALVQRYLSRGQQQGMLITVQDPPAPQP